MSCSPRRYRAEQVRDLSATTIAYYDRFARAFWNGTRHHDVSENYAAFLDAIEGDPPYSILDLGCGPGRDLSHFRSLGHEAVGLDGGRLPFPFGNGIVLVLLRDGCWHQRVPTVSETFSPRLQIGRPP